MIVHAFYSSTISSILVYDDLMIQGGWGSRIEEKVNTTLRMCCRTVWFNHRLYLQTYIENPCVTILALFAQKVLALGFLSKSSKTAFDIIFDAGQFPGSG